MTTAPSGRGVASTAMVAAALVAGFGYLVWRAGWTLDGAWWPLAVATFVAELLIYLRFALRAAPELGGRSAAPLDPPQRVPDVDVFLVVRDEPTIQVRVALRACLEVRGRTSLAVVAERRRHDVAEICERMGVIHRAPPGPGEMGEVLDRLMSSRPGELIAVVPASSWPTPDLAVVPSPAFDDPSVGAVACSVGVSGTVGLVGGDGYRPAADSDQGLAERLCGRGITPALDNPVLFRRAALRAIGGLTSGSLRPVAHTLHRLRAEGWATTYATAPVAYHPAPADEEHALRVRDRLARGRRDLVRQRDVGWTARSQSGWGRLPHLIGVSELGSVLPRLFLLLLPGVVAISGRLPLVTSLQTLVVFGGLWGLSLRLALRVLRPDEPLGAEARRGMRTLWPDLAVLGGRRERRSARLSTGQGRILVLLLLASGAAIGAQASGLAQQDLPDLANAAVMIAGMVTLWMIRDSVWADRQHRALPRAVLEPTSDAPIAGEVVEVSPFGIDVAGGLTVGEEITVPVGLPLPGNRTWRRDLVGEVVRNHAEEAGPRTFIRLHLDEASVDELAYYCGVTAPTLAWLGQEIAAFGLVRTTQPSPATA